MLSRLWFGRLYTTLKGEEYIFIVITPISTLAQSGYTCNCQTMGQKKTEKYSNSIEYLISYINLPTPMYKQEGTQLF